LNRDGARKLAQVTEKNVGKAMAIVLKDKVVAAPTIQEKIMGGAMNITEGSQKVNGPSLFEQLCLNPVTLKLPDHLKL
jgi:preprotein translocase subunit SecD